MSISPSISSDANCSVSSTSLSVGRQVRDDHCWSCHYRVNNTGFFCSHCPRAYHRRPACGGTKTSDRCPQCIEIFNSSFEGNAKTLKRLFINIIADLKINDRYQWFHRPVNTEEYPNYLQIIKYPMDLKTVFDKVKADLYSSTTSFMADIKWIHHNCLVYNSRHSLNNPVRTAGSQLLKTAANACMEIDVCADCCLNYCLKSWDEYFVSVCSRPHNVVRAKCGDHPLWPGKVTQYDQQNDKVLVHFFGSKHEWDWLPIENCFLLTKQSYPLPQKEVLEEAVYEMRIYLRNLRRRKIKFPFSSAKTVLTREMLYLKTEESSLANCDMSQEVDQKMATEVTKEPIDTKSPAKRLFEQSFEPNEISEELVSIKEPIDSQRQPSDDNSIELKKKKKRKRKKSDVSTSVVEMSDCTQHDSSDDTRPEPKATVSVVNDDQIEEVISDVLNINTDTNTEIETNSVAKVDNSCRKRTKLYSIELDGDIRGFCCELDNCDAFEYSEEAMVRHQSIDHNITVGHINREEEETFRPTKRSATEEHSESDSISATKTRKLSTNDAIDEIQVIDISDDDIDAIDTPKTTNPLNSTTDFVKEYIREEIVGERSRFRCTFFAECKQLKFANRLLAKQHINDHLFRLSYN